MNKTNIKTLFIVLLLIVLATVLYKDSMKNNNRENLEQVPARNDTSSVDDLASTSRMNENLNSNNNDASNTDGFGAGASINLNN